jgi:adenine phosphoribosyltransferase
VEGDAGWLKDYVRDVPDFPRPGVVFKDLTPLLGDAEAFRFSVTALAEGFADERISKVVGIEARGFIVAAPVALQLGAGFVPVRKTGKLPWETEQETYVLEYGSDVLEVHADALGPGDRVLIVDDVMATGGTAAATVTLVERLGASVSGLAFLIELGFLEGRRKLGGHSVTALVRYE